MSEIKISNLVRATIADSGGLADDATSVTLNLLSGTLPTLAAGDWFRMVLIRASDQAKEFIKVTALSGSGPYTATIARGEEDSTPLEFEQGDAAELRFTAQTFEDYRDGLKALIDAANAAASSAVSAAENANTLAAQALAQIDGLFPVTDEDDLADNLIKPVHLHSSIVGQAITGGAGLPIALKINSSYLEVNGSNELTLKAASLVPSLFVGANIVKASTPTSEGSVIWVSQPTAGCVYGPKTTAGFVFAVLTSSSASAQSINALIGPDINYLANGGTATPFYEVNRATINGAGHRSTICFFVPQGWQWCIGGSSFTTLTFHYFMPIQ